MSTSSETVSNTPSKAAPDASSGTGPTAPPEAAAPAAPVRGTRLTLAGASLGRPDRKSVV